MAKHAKKTASPAVVKSGARVTVSLAAAAAGLLAAGGVANAGASTASTGAGENGAHTDSVHVHDDNDGKYGDGINAFNDNNITIPIQACGNDVAVLGGVVDIGSASATECNQAAGAGDAEG